MDVTLVSMPFAELQRPSIALGLLRAALAGTGIQSEVLYANFGFAETVGIAAYQAIQNTPTDHLLGEWCFSGGMFPELAAKDEEYLDLVLDIRCQGFPPELAERKAMMRWMRAQTGAYLDRLAGSIVEGGARIVGCSSVFQQHCASLALLKRVRELAPDTVTLVGGANCEGEMGVETLRAFPWVDCAVSGEADGMFRELCQLLLEHGRNVDPAALPHGAIWQKTVRPSALTVLSTAGASPPPRPVLRDLDVLPTPDYDQYFETLRRSPLAQWVRPGLLAESSRGCWWGEKSHCTFCGLNGDGMRYRAKSPDRVLAELAEMDARYGLRNVQFVDNILDMSYLRTLLPRLAESAVPYDLFYEIKANLRRDQVKMLRVAGVRWIQPGIESLDDNVLRLIGKGNSAIINLQLLKWSQEFGIHAAWNILSGLPGESDSWYSEMAEWLPAIFHLQPPSGVARVRYDRFSPYHTRARDFGLELQPSRAYRYVYPLPNESLMRLAYSFEDRNDRGHAHRGVLDQPGQLALQEAVVHWNEAWHSPHRGMPPMLRYRDDGERVSFTDTRACAREREWTADEVASAVYRACDTAQSAAGIAKALRHSASEIDDAIASLCDAKVLLRVSGKLLGVAVNAS